MSTPNIGFFQNKRDILERLQQGPSAENAAGDNQSDTGGYDKRLWA